MRSSRFVVMCAFAASCLLALSARAEEPAIVGKLKQTIEEKGKTICRLSHPLGKYQSIKLTEQKAADGKQTLVYAITWTGKEDKVEKEMVTTYAIDYTVNEKGEIGDVSMKVLSDESSHTAFKGAKLIMMPVRARLKNWINKNADGEEKKAMLAKVDDLDGEGVVSWLLKFATNKPDESTKEKEE